MIITSVWGTKLSGLVYSGEWKPADEREIYAQVVPDGYTDVSGEHRLTKISLNTFCLRIMKGTVFISHLLHMGGAGWQRKRKDSSGESISAQKNGYAGDQES